MIFVGFEIVYGEDIPKFKFNNPDDKDFDITTLFPRKPQTNEDLIYFEGNKQAFDYIDVSLDEIIKALEIARQWGNKYKADDTDSELTFSGSEEDKKNKLDYKYIIEILNKLKQAKGD